MGHQHYSTTQRYLHHKPRREDAARLARAFGEQAGTNPGTNRSARESKTEQDDAAGRA